MAQSKSRRKNEKSQSRPKRQKPETGKNPTGKDKNWRLADDEYAFFKSMLMIQMPMFEPMDEEEKTKRLEQILEICPEYFLARIDLGLNMFNRKLVSEARKEIIQAVDDMFKRGDEEEQEAYVEQLFDLLTNTGGFEIIRDVLEIALRHSPDNLTFNDIMGHVGALTDDVETFEKCMKRCLEDKKNGTYINNYGLGKQILGDLDTAEEYLRKALTFKVSKQDAEDNLQVLKWMRKKAGRTRQDYFAKSIDMKEIDDLFEQEEEDKANNLVKEHNYEILNYVIYQLGRNGEYELCVTVKHTLEAFFRFVRQIYQDIFIWDDIDFLDTHLRRIMHKFIFKHKDVDKETIDEIFDSLEAFFSIIAENQHREIDGLDEFIAQLDRTRPEMLEKTDKYNAVRHDPKISEKKLDKIREELFEGDHGWMFF